MVPLRGGAWAEVRILAIGCQPRATPADPTPRTTQVSYFSRLSDAASFERLRLIETQRRGLERAGTIAGVADGAE
jgi:transposase